MSKHEITRDDVMDPVAYAKMRKERKRAVAEIKKDRRVAVGPDATFYFECYETMWHQVHEMVYIEKGGPAQVADELAAYNPLIPKGRELVATLMFEIEDAVRRGQTLAALGGVEETVTMAFEGEAIRGVPEADLDRTTAAGKASSVQFLHFAFTDGQVARFKTPGTRVTLTIDHPNYGHAAVLPEAVRQALAGDFD